MKRVKSERIYILQHAQLQANPCSGMDIFFFVEEFIRKLLTPILPFASLVIRNLSSVLILKLRSKLSFFCCSFLKSIK